MAESDKNKSPTVVEASPMSEASPEDDTVETPMLAVWLVLGAILCAGLYGLYLGKSAPSQAKPDATKTSSYSAALWAGPGRLS